MKYRQSIKIVCLFALLLSVVSIPAVLSKNQNGYMVNEIAAFPVEADSFNVSSSARYNLWERIKIPQKTTAVRVVDKNDFEARTISDESVKELIHCMEEQIKKIQDCRALPEFEFSEILKGYVVTDFYMDTANPNYVDILGVWAIYAQYEDFSVIAYMDTQTFAIFEIEVIAETEKFIYQPNITPEGFLEYLSFFSDIAKEDEEEFRAYGSYNNKAIHLYLASINKTTLKEILYRFSS